MERSILSVLAFTVSAMLFSCKETPAPPTTGNIYGRITDTTGNGVANAYVNSNPPSSAILNTDANGYYSLKDVSPGNYTITASKTGYSTGSSTVNVKAGYETRCDIILGFVPSDTINGPRYALEMGTNDSYCQIPYNQSLHLSKGNFTLEAWIKISSFTDFNWIFGKSKGNTSLDFLFGVDHLIAGNKLRFITRNLANDITGKTVLNTGVWYHIAAVQDSTNSKFTIYLNGAAEASKQSLSGSGIDVPVDLLLGGRHNTAGVPAELFKGSMDELRIWNVARTQQEIANNMSLHLKGNETGLLAYWRLDEGVGSIISDATGHGYQGLLKNNPLWITSTVPLH